MGMNNEEALELALRKEALDDMTIQRAHLKARLISALQEIASLKGAVEKLTTESEKKNKPQEKPKGG